MGLFQQHFNLYQNQAQLWFYRLINIISFLFIAQLYIEYLSIVSLNNSDVVSSVIIFTENENILYYLTLFGLLICLSLQIIIKQTYTIFKFNLSVNFISRSYTWISILTRNFINPFLYMQSGYLLLFRQNYPPAIIILLVVVYFDYSSFQKTNIFQFNGINVVYTRNQVYYIILKNLASFLLIPSSESMFLSLLLLITITSILIIIFHIKFSITGEQVTDYAIYSMASFLLFNSTFGIINFYLGLDFQLSLKIIMPISILLSIMLLLLEINIHNKVYVKIAKISYTIFNIHSSILQINAFENNQVQNDNLVEIQEIYLQLKNKTFNFYSESYYLQLSYYYYLNQQFTDKFLNYHFEPIGTQLLQQEKYYSYKEIQQFIKVQKIKSKELVLFYQRTQLIIQKYKDFNDLSLLCLKIPFQKLISFDSTTLNKQQVYIIGSQQKEQLRSLAFSSLAFNAYLNPIDGSKQYANSDLSQVSSIVDPSILPQSIELQIPDQIQSVYRRCQYDFSLKFHKYIYYSKNYQILVVKQEQFNAITNNARFLLSFITKFPIIPIINDLAYNDINAQFIYVYNNFVQYADQTNIFDYHILTQVLLQKHYIQQLIILKDDFNEVQTSFVEGNLFSELFDNIICLSYYYIFNILESRNQIKYFSHFDYKIDKGQINYCNYLQEHQSLLDHSIKLDSSEFHQYINQQLIQMVQHQEQIVTQNINNSFSIQLQAQIDQDQKYLQFYELQKQQLYIIQSLDSLMSTYSTQYSKLNHDQQINSFIRIIKKLITIINLQVSNYIQFQKYFNNSLQFDEQLFTKKQLLDYFDKNFNDFLKSKNNTKLKDTLDLQIIQNDIYIDDIYSKGIRKLLQLNQTTFQTQINKYKNLNDFIQQNQTKYHISSYILALTQKKQRNMLISQFNKQILLLYMLAKQQNCSKSIFNVIESFKIKYNLNSIQQFISSNRILNEYSQIDNLELYLILNQINSYTASIVGIEQDIQVQKPHVKQLLETNQEINQQRLLFIQQQQYPFKSNLTVQQQQIKDIKNNLIKNKIEFVTQDFNDENISNLDQLNIQINAKIKTSVNIVRKVDDKLFLDVKLIFFATIFISILFRLIQQFNYDMIDFYLNSFEILIINQNFPLIVNIMDLERNIVSKFASICQAFDCQEIQNLKNICVSYSGKLFYDFKYNMMFVVYDSLNSVHSYYSTNSHKLIVAVRQIYTILLSQYWHLLQNQYTKLIVNLQLGKTQLFVTIGDYIRETRQQINQSIYFDTKYVYIQIIIKELVFDQNLQFNIFSLLFGKLIQVIPSLFGFVITQIQGQIVYILSYLDFLESTYLSDLLVDLNIETINSTTSLLYNNQTNVQQQRKQNISYIQEQSQFNVTQILPKQLMNIILKKSIITQYQQNPYSLNQLNQQNNFQEINNLFLFNDQINYILCFILLCIFLSMSYLLIQNNKSQIKRQQIRLKNNVSISENHSTLCKNKILLNIKIKIIFIFSILVALLLCNSPYYFSQTINEFKFKQNQSIRLYNTQKLQLEILSLQQQSILYQLYGNNKFLKNHEQIYGKLDLFLQQECISIFNFNICQDLYQNVQQQFKAQVLANQITYLFLQPNQQVNNLYKEWKMLQTSDEKLFMPLYIKQFYQQLFIEDKMNISKQEKINLIEFQFQNYYLDCYQQSLEQLNLFLQDIIDYGIDFDSLYEQNFPLLIHQDRILKQLHMQDKVEQILQEDIIKNNYHFNFGIIQLYQSLLISLFLTISFFLFSFLFYQYCRKHFFIQKYMLINIVLSNMLIIVIFLIKVYLVTQQQLLHQSQGSELNKYNKLMIQVFKNQLPRTTQFNKLLNIQNMEIFASNVQLSFGPQTQYDKISMETLTNTSTDIFINYDQYINTYLNGDINIIEMLTNGIYLNDSINVYNSLNYPLISLFQQQQVIYADNYKPFTNYYQKNILLISLYTVQICYTITINCQFLFKKILIKNIKLYQQQVVSQPWFIVNLQKREQSIQPFTQKLEQSISSCKFSKNVKIRLKQQQTLIIILHFLKNNPQFFLKNKLDNVQINIYQKNSIEQIVSTQTFISAQGFCNQCSLKYYNSHYQEIQQAQQQQQQNIQWKNIKLLSFSLILKIFILFYMTVIALLYLRQKKLEQEQFKVFQQASFQANKIQEIFYPFQIQVISQSNSQKPFQSDLVFKQINRFVLQLSQLEYYDAFKKFKIQEFIQHRLYLIQQIVFQCISEGFSFSDLSLHIIELISTFNELQNSFKQVLEEFSQIQQSKLFIYQLYTIFSILFLSFIVFLVDKYIQYMLNKEIIQNKAFEGIMNSQQVELNS